MSVLTLWLYFAVLALLCAYGIHRAYLVALLHRYPCQEETPPVLDDADLPSVTVQLPVFNEANVVERLIDTACALDYPHHRLHIQVLDDSNDETLEISRRVVDRYRRRSSTVICERSLQDSEIDSRVQL